jgi:hypothetical protein
MSAPTPQPGDTNVRGCVTAFGAVEALETIYGQRKADAYNPLVFYTTQDIALPVGAEVLFDVAAFFDGRPYATNVRAA